MKSKFGCVITSLLIALSSHANASGDAVHPHWIGLFPGHFFEEYVIGERRNNSGNWTVPIYGVSDSTAESIGTIKIDYVPNTGLSAEYKMTNSNTVISVKPHLFEHDYGYGPYFHLTIIEEENKLYKIRVTDSEHYWADFVAAFGSKNLAIIYLNTYEHRIFDWENADGEIESIYVEHADASSLVVRPSQPIDMWCGDETLRFTPYETRLIPMSEWIKSTGESRFNITNTRGC